MSASLRPVSPALPTTIEEWNALYNHKQVLSLTDKVELIHRRLLQDATYRSYITAIYPWDAVTGRVIFDRAKAVEIIQAEAAQVGGMEDLTRVENMGKIAAALKYVLSRFSQGHKSRHRRATEAAQTATEA